MKEFHPHALVNCWEKKKQGENMQQKLQKQNQHSRLMWVISVFFCFVFFLSLIGWCLWYDGDNEAHCFPTWSQLTAQVQIQWRLFEAVPKATWVISIFPPSTTTLLHPPTSLTALPLWIAGGSPEHSNQRGVNGVSIVDVHVVPAALCGKVIEAQPEHCIRAARQGGRDVNVAVRKYIWQIDITFIHTAIYSYFWVSPLFMKSAVTVAHRHCRGSKSFSLYRCD